MDEQAHGRILQAAERGCLLVGDVSGYTGYLRKAELEHAQDVLADLIETVVGHLTPTLRLSKLEGDAAFAYALETEIEASMLLDTVEGTYFAFRSRVRDIGHATTCDCNACMLIPQLNLKFVVHHGEFVRRAMAGHEELTGTDVILVHRLLKNTVGEELDLEGYAFLTEPCVAALGIDPEAVGMRPHRERYPDVGEVAGYVEDLETRWRYEDERRRIFVVPAEAEFEFVEELPAPAPIVWEYVTSPHKRKLWGLGVTDIEEDTRGGRRGTGTMTHCVHGRQAIVEEILDWRPFRYFTQRRILPAIGAVTVTWELKAAGDDATEVHMRCARLDGMKQRLLWALMRRRVSADWNEQMTRLRALLAEETAGVGV